MLKTIERYLKPVLMGCLALLISANAMAAVPQIAANFANHSLLLKPDGTVWAWGDNTHGQLGIGVNAIRIRPQQVPNLGGVLAVATGTYHSVAVKHGGTVWAWGGNQFGQLGDGSATDRFVPVPVPNLSGVTAVAAGYGFTLALKSDGTVWAWGINDYGQLGNGTTVGNGAPVQVHNLSGVKAISAQGYAGMALKNDGTVWTWGYNGNGNLGDGTTVNRSTPVQVQGLPTNVVSITGGGDSYALALLSNGNVMGWGSNHYNVLGGGDTGNESLPVSVISGDTRSVVAGHHHVLAIRTDGTVWTWGMDTAGELGLRDPVVQWPPVPIVGVTDALAVAGGWFHSLILQNDGTLLTLGRGAEGQLGNGKITDASSPQIASSASYVEVAAGAQHAVALKDGGRLFTWGRSDHGQTAVPYHGAVATPAAIAATYEPVVAMAAGGNETLASRVPLTSVATAFGVGDNTYGQLGNGQVGGTVNVDPVTVSGLTRPLALAVSYTHTLALKEDGTVVAWGNNDYGQLGDGTTQNSAVPVAVSGLTDVVAIAAGKRNGVGGQSLALKRDGTVWAWGSNRAGQLGNGTDPDTNSHPNPVQVLNPEGTGPLTNVVAIASGSDFNFALLRDGTVWGWGYSHDGQLGDGSTSVAHRTLPIQASGLTDVVSIAAGVYHGQAVRRDGTAWFWGKNPNGQLGDGTQGNTHFSPIQIPGIDHARAVAAGFDFSLIQMQDGSLRGAGENDPYQELGNGGRGDSWEIAVAGVAEDNFGAAIPAGWTATAGSSASWLPVSDIKYAGAYALRSGAIGDGQESGMKVSGFFRDGYLRFQTKVQSDGDQLILLVDSLPRAVWASTLDWRQFGLFLPAGQHTIEWKFVKPGSGHPATDAAWIDAVELPAVTSLVGFASASTVVNKRADHVTLTVRRLSGSVGAVSVNYATNAGTAVAGTDFVAKSGTLSWADGETSDKTITVTILNNASASTARQFTVDLTAPPDGAILSTSTETVKIMRGGSIAPLLLLLLD